MKVSGFPTKNVKSHGGDWNPGWGVEPKQYPRIQVVLKKDISPKVSSSGIQSVNANWEPSRHWEDGSNALNHDLDVPGS